jgi:Protein of unknown function (DUF2933)
VTGETPAIERFGERFCSESHAEDFVAGVRAARIQGAAQDETRATACAPARAGQLTWKDYLKQGACWGAPLLLLLAIPLLWTGSAWGATGGSLLSVLALLACPLGMYFMMRAMGQTDHRAHDERASPAGRRRE